MCVVSTDQQSTRPALIHRNAPNHRFWDSVWSRQWYGTLSGVQAGGPRCESAEISQFGSRPLISVSPMGSEPQNPRGYRNQNGFLCSVVPSLHRAIDRNNSQGMLDQLMFWTGTDLEVKLNAFTDFYNKHRTHAALKGATPVETPEHKGLSFKSYGWRTHCRGLYQTPIAA
jgi:hypothetical protein